MQMSMATDGNLDIVGTPVPFDEQQKVSMLVNC